MSYLILSEMETNKKRLEYYQTLKESQGNTPSPVLEKWITIYSDRVKNLEKMAQKKNINLNALQANAVQH